jgi:hypothetical protein
MLSAIRNCQDVDFDFLTGVLFDQDFTFLKACLVPHAVVLTSAKHRQHGNAHIFELPLALGPDQ